jgi:hypothetical protein
VLQSTKNESECWNTILEEIDCCSANGEERVLQSNSGAERVLEATVEQNVKARDCKQKDSLTPQKGKAEYVQQSALCPR